MIDDADKNLFRDAVDNQKLIDKDAILNVVEKPNQKAVFQLNRRPSQANLSGFAAVSYAKNGVAAKTIKKMRQGKIGQPPTLDLHGQTVEQAYTSLSKFIHHHQRQQYIHIIHGKGHHSDNGIGVLKDSVVHYLKQHPAVLSFVSCPAKNGGSGALFVLLKITKSSYE